jgi:hypothetical protein
MIEAYALLAVALAVAGIVLTLLVVIWLKIRGEDAAYSSRGPPPTGWPTGYGVSTACTSVTGGSHANPA